MPLTFTRAVNNFQSAVTNLVGTLDKQLDAFTGLATAIDYISNHLSSFATVVLGGVLAFAMRGLNTSLATTAVSFAAATAESIRYQTALATMAGTTISTATATRMAAISSATAMATTSLRAFGAALMAMVGGPIGLVITASVGIMALAYNLRETAFSAEALTEKLGVTNDQLDLMSKTEATNKIFEINQALVEQTEQLTKLNTEFETLNENYQNISDPEALLIGGAEFEKLASQIHRTQQEIVVLGKAQSDLGGVADGTRKKQNSFNDAMAETAKKGKSAADKIRELISAYQFETNTLLMNNKEKEQAIFLQTLENEGIKQGTALWYEFVAIRSQAERERFDMEIIKAGIDARIKAEEDAVEARIKAEEDYANKMEKIGDQIGQSLADALMQGSLDAKDFMVNLFKTLILRPLLQPMISGTMAMFGSAAASASGISGIEGAVAGGGGMDFFGLASTLKDGYSMLSGGFAAVGVAASEMAASFTYGTSLMSQQTAMLAAQEAGMATTVGAVGAAATVLAGVAAGIGAGTFISGQYALGGDQIISTGIGTAIGTGIGFAIGGPIGAAIGALVGGAGGGLINRAFGQGPKQTQNSGLIGTIGAGGTSLSSFTDWKRSGGWFSSGSSGRSYGGVDQGIVDYFNNTLALVSGSVAVMAESIGLSTDQISGYTQQIELSLLGLTEVQAQEKLQEAINNFTNGLIIKSLPVIKRYQRESETASDTLTRLSQSLATANQIFKAMDLTTYDLTVQSAESASKLIDLTGGIDQFLSKMDFVYQNFFSAQDRIDKAVANLSSTFDSLGLVVPSTREQFKQLIEVIQAAGSTTLLAALLEVAPAFDSVTTAVEQQSASASQISQQILNERIQFENKIYQALGDTAALRQRELDSIDESNRGLAMALYALADAQDALSIATDQTDKAFSDLEKSLAERLTATLTALKNDFDSLTKSLDEQIEATLKAESAAQSNINSLKSIFDYLQEQINDINGLGKTSYSYAQAMAYLSQAEQNITNGKGFPEQAQLAAAVSGARASLSDTSMFASSFEQQRATGLLVAQLTRLKDATANQLSIEEKQLIVAQEQLRSLYSTYDQATLQYSIDQEAARAAYDNDLNAAKNQIDVLRGIDNSVYSVEEAIERLNVSTLAERERIVNLQQIMVSLQQDANARAQAEADRIEAERQAAINAEKARVEALRQAQIRAEQQAAAERAAEAERIAAQQRAEAAAAAARAAAAAAEAERLRREAEARAAWFNGMFWGDWGSSSTTNQSDSWFLPTNADGGMFQGGLSIVGEEGPELVNFARPSMIYTANETADILSGGKKTNNESISEIRQLRAENQAQSRAMVNLQNRMTKLLERWDGNGLPQERVEA